jgi:hypothetical protein
MKCRKGGRRSRVLAFLVGISILGSEAWSVPIRVRIAAIDESAADFGVVQVVASPQQAVPDGSSAHAETGLTLDGTAEATFDLPSGAWRLTARTEGFWAPTKLVPIEADEMTVSFDMWPTGFLQGTVRAPRGEEPPRQLDLDFQPSPERQGSRAVPPGQVSCPVNDDAWTCEVPAGKLDLQLAASEYIHQFRWDVRVARGKTTVLDPVDLKRGSAVRGWLVTEDGTSPQDVLVELAPRMTRRLPEEEAQTRTKPLALSTRVNHRGFFQIDAVSPGDYVLTATKKPFALAQTSVRVLEGQPTEIVRPPLTLHLPHPLTIYVEPPVPPAADHWTAKLSRLDRGGSPIGTLDESAVPPDGAWEVEEVPPGRYSLSLSMADLDRWFWQELEIDRSTSQHFVDVPIVEIRGTVVLGEDPLPSRLTFGGKNAAVSIHLKADREGRFGGFLPGGGRWVVEVEADDPTVHRSFQREISPNEDLEIRIPDTRVRGVVIDEAGSGVPAMVRIKSTDLFGMPADVATDDEGRFESIGLPAGRTSFIAEAYELSSDVQEVLLEEDRSPPDLRLVLRRNTRASGRIVGSSGGVPGAGITALSVEAFYLGASLESSDLQGNFDFDVPGGTRSMIVQIAAPGFAFRTLRVAPAEERLILPVSQDSGTLVVELPESFDRGRWETPQIIVFHADSFVGLYRLQGWAASNGQAQEPGNRYVIPFMEPGDYRACQVQVTEALALLAGSALDVACVGGSLPIAGELILSLANPSS